MKREILLSAGGHFIIISALLLISTPFGKDRTYPTIYQVSLISLPKIEIKTAEAKAETQVPSKVTVREEKVLPKKSSPKKKPPEPVKEEQPKPQEQTPQQIEGLGEATFEGGKLESPYYAGIVFAKIKSMWRNPVQGITLQATIVFKIQKNGEVTDAAIEVSCGNNLYDQAALRAVLTSSPLPALPTHYVGKDLAVHLNFVGVP